MVRGGRGYFFAAGRAAVVADEDEAARDPGAPAGREALGELAPRGDDLLAAAAALGLALAAAVRVVDRVHRHPAHAGAPPQPAVAAGLAKDWLAWSPLPTTPMVARALGVHQADLAGGHLQLGVACSTATSSMLTPADRPIWAPLPGTISTQWIRVEGGSSRGGSSCRP